MDYSIVPAILRKTDDEYLTDLEASKSFAKELQIDYVDGLFAPEPTVTVKTILDHPASVPTEIDLMVAHPHDDASYFYGADWVAAIIIHLESLHNAEDARLLSENIRAAKKHCVFAMNPGFAVSDWDLTAMADSIMVMGIQPGAQGQPFESKSLETIEQVRSRYPYVTIEVDGHVTDQTLPLLIKAGANRFASGSFIFQSTDPKSQYEKLVSLLPQSSKV